MNIGDKIIALRTEKKMSQSELAELLNVSRQTVSKWECNICEPGIERIKQMTTIFNVTADYLLDINTDNKILNNDYEKIKKKSMTKQMKIAIFLGIISVLFLISTIIYCYIINPYTYKPKDGAWQKGIMAHILGYKEIGLDGVTLLSITLVTAIAFIILLLLAILKKRGENKC